MSWFKEQSEFLLLLTFFLWSLNSFKINFHIFLYYKQVLSSRLESAISKLQAGCLVAEGCIFAQFAAAKGHWFARLIKRELHRLEGWTYMARVAERCLLTHAAWAPEVILSTIQRFVNNVRTNTLQNWEWMLAFISLQATLQIAAFILNDWDALVLHQVRVHQRFHCAVSCFDSLTGRLEFLEQIIIAIAFHITNFLLKLRAGWNVSARCVSLFGCPLFSPLLLCGLFNIWLNCFHLRFCLSLGWFFCRFLREVIEDTIVESLTSSEGRLLPWVQQSCSSSRVMRLAGCKTKAIEFLHF